MASISLFQRGDEHILVSIGGAYSISRVLSVCFGVAYL